MNPLLIIVLSVVTVLGLMALAALAAPKMIGYGASGLQIEDTPVLNNKTGSPIVQGGIYAADTLRSDGSSVSPDTMLRNAVGVASGHITNGGRYYIAQVAIPTGGSGQFMGHGIGPALVNGALTVGCKLMCSATHNYLILWDASSDAVGRLLDPSATYAATAQNVEFFGTRI